MECEIKFAVKYSYIKKTAIVHLDKGFVHFLNQTINSTSYYNFFIGLMFITVFVSLEVSI